MARVRLRPFLVALCAGVAIVVALLLAGVGSRQLFERPLSATPPSPIRVTRKLIPEADPGRFRVVGLQGDVECLQEGRTFSLQPGDLLSLQDVVRTAAHARVVLRRGGSEIEVRENLEVRVEELAAQTAKFAVLSGEGNMAASVEGNEETLAIAADKTLAINEGASRWVVARSETGQVAVAVSEGQVRFGAQGQSVEVKSGSESVAMPGQPPSAPTAYSDDLLLSVIWPEAPAKPSAQIHGMARPSSQVVVNGQPVQVNADGTFVAEVPLQLGANAVEVKARDMEGRQKEVRGTVKRVPPAGAPSLEAQKEELWAP